jgi:hypothetical protein
VVAARLRLPAHKNNEQWEASTFAAKLNFNPPQALVSIVEDGLHDTLHSIQAGRCVIAFVKQDPLVFVAVGSHAEPEAHVWCIVYLRP